MSSDVNKVIVKSIERLISEEPITEAGIIDKAKSFYKGAIDTLSQGKLGEFVYDKLHHPEPDKDYRALEMVRRMQEVNKRLKQAEEELRREREIGGREHLARAGKKTLAAIKKTAGEHFTLNPNEMDLPQTGALAAAVTAGLGALALRKKLKNTGK